MDLCRICLSKSPEKDINELNLENDVTKSFHEILLFCLSIQVTNNPTFTTKLCTKCYRKIIAFYKFKTLALQSDSYLKSVDLKCTVKLEVFVKEDDEEHLNIQDHDQRDTDSMNYEVVKYEEESDDELLSVIKKVKEQNSHEDDNMLGIKNGNIKKVKRRGRPRMYVEKSPFKKQICEECGKSVWDIKKHLDNHAPKQDRKLIPCSLCEKTFLTNKSLRKHFDSKHLGIKHRCDICGKEVGHLKMHKLRMHYVDQLKYRCIICEKRYMSQSLLDSHMLVHTKDRPFKCDICQNRYRTKLIMLQHKQRVHDKEKNNLCQFCPKRFYKKYHLQIHIRSHTNERPHKCEQCGQSFFNSTGLKNHKETHNTEKNFQCEFCDMKFNRRAYLRSHLVCHSKEKKYPCKYCGVSFGRSDHRKRHQYTAHEKHTLAAA